jgi:hypothetical protein
MVTVHRKGILRVKKNKPHLFYLIKVIKDVGGLSGRDEFMIVLRGIAKLIATVIYMQVRNNRIKIKEQFPAIKKCHIELT